MTQSHAVSIIGAGNMGTGFAVHFVLQDQSVTLIDHRQSNLDEAREQISEVIRFHNEEGLSNRSPDDVLDDIEFTLDQDAGVADADIVLETVTEDLAVKHEVFSAVGAAAPEDAVLASNTSSLPITDIAEGAPEYADRIVGCHWWFPPYMLRPVEVVRGQETSDETMERTTAFVEAVDRYPVVVKRDVPGFVWNRIQFAVLRECMHLVAEDVASIEDINTAIRDGYARRTTVIGPFETMDLAGLELFETVAGLLYPHLCNDREPNEAFDWVLDRGTGVEDGIGFFEYDESPDEVARRRDEQIAAIHQALAALDTDT